MMIDANDSELIGVLRSPNPNSQSNPMKCAKKREKSQIEFLRRGILWTEGFKTLPYNCRLNAI